MEDISIYRFMKFGSLILISLVIFFIFLEPLIVKKETQQSVAQSNTAGIEKNLKSFFDSVDKLQNNFVDVYRRKVDMEYVRDAIERYRYLGGECTEVSSFTDLNEKNLNGKDGFNGIGGKYPSDYLEGGVYPKDPLTDKEKLLYYQIKINNEECTSYVIHAPFAQDPASAPDIVVETKK